ncbi:adenylyl-sulfate kinase [Dinghuibacter silviterrae]|uniref:Adenylyl-sulfate kinase n=1 Tax=Dinghuibacter silviterrae TaxID=1539049 RepID=A0A4R8DT45_9BACT|nr:adenylyl-sulfate kinase [Dinghuibacter silviterrae]TDX01440.1 adenylylsulfate kinase [Dinghuibacter silviterrae]
MSTTPKQYAGYTVWLTGFSGAGKTTIAHRLSATLTSLAHPVEVLDGDAIRASLSKGLTFSREDRCENILRLGFVSELLSRHGVGVIVSAISPYRSARDMVRGRIPNFIEVHVKCSIGECERRDVKGLYKKVRAGEISHFTGIDDPYEEPADPEVTCCTELETVEESTAKICAELIRRKLITVPPGSLHES